MAITCTHRENKLKVRGYFHVKLTTRQCLEAQCSPCKYQVDSFIAYTSFLASSALAPAIINGYGGWDGGKNTPRGECPP